MNFLYKPTDKKTLIKLIHKTDVQLGQIDTSLIKDMSGLFEDSERSDFSGLEYWNTSQVVNMSRMFSGAKAFNYPIGNWDTSHVTDMNRMFECAEKFDQPIGSWDTSLVTDMNSMFNGAENLISRWRTGILPGLLI
jgi:MoxR-like ATPase